MSCSLFTKCFRRKCSVFINFSLSVIWENLSFPTFLRQSLWIIWVMVNVFVCNFKKIRFLRFRFTDKSTIKSEMMLLSNCPNSNFNLMDFEDLLSRVFIRKLLLDFGFYGFSEMLVRKIKQMKIILNDLVVFFWKNVPLFISYPLRFRVAISTVLKKEVYDCRKILFFFLTISYSFHMMKIKSFKNLMSFSTIRHLYLKASKIDDHWVRILL